MNKVLFGICLILFTVGLITPSFSDSIFKDYYDCVQVCEETHVPDTVSDSTDYTESEYVKDTNESDRKFVLLFTLGLTLILLIMVIVVVKITRR